MWGQDDFASVLDMIHLFGGCLFVVDMNQDINCL